MDEEKLKKILENMDIPPADENARKRAVNLAVAEFKSLENKRKNTLSKIPQGIPFLSRLMNRTTSNGRDSMEQKIQQKSHRKLIYGGMATAMAVVLIAGVTFTQLQNSSRSGGGDANVMRLAKVEFEGDQIASSPAYEIGEEMVHTQGSGTLSSPPASIDQLSAVDQEATLQKSRALSPEMRQEKATASVSGYGAKIAVMESIAPEPVPPQDFNNSGYHDEGRDKFKDFDISPIKIVSEEPVSTFSIDVDTSSYSFMRGQLNNGVLPQKDAVRPEEMINYFDYNYPLPETKDEPFKPTVTVVNSPWNKDKKLIHIGIKGYDIDKSERPHANLVFLLDTSGSMNEPDKLPLLKNSLKMLVDNLDANDRVSIVVYAGSAGTVLEPTKAGEKSKILSAIENLNAGGSTAGAEGINLAYQLAEQNFDKESVNRVILATDGDFNVGITSEEELKDFIERKRESGIFLSVLGFGQGNLNDSLMQTLAQNGNGAAAYIDNLNEARKVLVEEASSTLFPIAKDVKIQVEFNPETVAEYRLVGYETRALNREDFNNDKIDAGDIGAGHAVTAIYEITPSGAPRSVDDSRYADKVLLEKKFKKTDAEYAFLKIRYKLPDGDTSKLITTPITAEKEISITCPPLAKCVTENLPRDVTFATAVAGFAQLLKGDSHIGSLTYDDVIAMAQSARGDDPFGQRAEFITLVRLTKTAAAQ